MMLSVLLSYGFSGSSVWLKVFILNGAGDRNRTRDLLITNQLLYQLSYAGPPKHSGNLPSMHAYQTLHAKHTALRIASAISTLAVHIEDSRPACLGLLVIALIHSSHRRNVKVTCMP
jgi:hypothetical protein